MASALRALVTGGSISDFQHLLAPDTLWRGEDGTISRGRAALGDLYAEIVARCVVLVEDVVDGGDSSDGSDGSDGTDARSGARLQVTVTLVPHRPGGRPHRHHLALTIEDGLITEVVQTTAPTRVEVLYVDNCPHHEELLPRLRQLLVDHDRVADLVTTLVESDDDARRLRFLGSPTVRVNGRDVDPAAAGRSGFGLQCRLYRAADGTVSATPSDTMIMDALVDLSPAATAARAIRAGDLATVRRLLDEHPSLAHGPLAELGDRTLLHVATDWPGHFPNVADSIALLITAGADPDAPASGPHAETPLHWAASSDDVDAIDALLDGGADINAPGAVIAGGTPMADATAFGQWAAAHRLLDRGARTNLWEAAALGVLGPVQRALDEDAPTTEDITHAFWGACHGGQATTAEVLLSAGADINWIGWDDLTPLEAARRSGAPEDLLAWLQDHGATSATLTEPTSPG